VHVVSFIATIVVHARYTCDSAVAAVGPGSTVVLRSDFSLFGSFLVVKVLAELLDTGAGEDAKDHSLILIEFFGGRPAKLHKLRTAVECFHSGQREVRQALTVVD